MTLAHFVIVVLPQHVELGPFSITGISSFERYTSSRPEIPGFPRWCGRSAVRNLAPSAAHSDHPKMARNSVGNLWVVSTSDDFSTIGSLQSSWTNVHPFPPSPPPSIPPTQASMCTPTQPCPSTPNVHISPTQTTSRSPPGPLPRSNKPSQSSTETRVYGFDLNEHWQADKDHYDNQKINGLTFPRAIRSSALTPKSLTLKDVIL